MKNRRRYVKVPIWWLDMGLSAIGMTLLASLWIELWILTCFCLGELVVVLTIRFRRIK